jgi:phage FluMu protein Com
MHDDVTKSKYKKGNIKNRIKLRITNGEPMLKVSCPRCKKVQNYEPRTKDLANKVKVCVYCGCSFKVHPRIISQKK